MARTCRSPRGARQQHSRLQNLVTPVTWPVSSRESWEEMGRLARGGSVARARGQMQSQMSTQWRNEQQSVRDAAGHPSASVNVTLRVYAAQGGSEDLTTLTISTSAAVLLAQPKWRLLHVFSAVPLKVTSQADRLVKGQREEWSMSGMPKPFELVDGGAASNQGV